MNNICTVVHFLYRHKLVSVSIEYKNEINDSETEEVKKNEYYIDNDSDLDSDTDAEV